MNGARILILACGLVLLAAAAWAGPPVVANPSAPAAIGAGPIRVATSALAEGRWRGLEDSQSNSHAAGINLPALARQYRAERMPRQRAAVVPVVFTAGLACSLVIVRMRRA